MPNSPRKNCPTLTIAIYHLKPWTWVLTQFWTFEIISINKKVTAFQTKVVFSFFVISSKLPRWILGTLRGPKKKIFFLVICMAMSYNILNFEPNRWLCCPKSVTLGMKPPFRQTYIHTYRQKPLLLCSIDDCADQISWTIILHGS